LDIVGALLVVENEIAELHASGVGAVSPGTHRVGLAAERIRNAVASRTALTSWRVPHALRVVVALGRGLVAQPAVVVARLPRRSLPHAEIVRVLALVLVGNVRARGVAG